MKEIWRDIPGYEGFYQVSDLGRVKSFVRGARILKAGRNTKQGHVTVSLRRNNSINVHRLVMLAFVGPCPEGFEVLHKNGVAGDNRLENLRYGTRSENNIDISKMGRRKLPLKHVPEIKAMYRAGISLSEISEKFGVSRAAVHAIGKRRYYKHVV